VADSESQIELGQTPPAALRLQAPWSERLFPNNEWVLLLALVVEVLIFSVTGRNFLTAGNGFEITRLAVETGLLALAMTPIIITGGIDLSVGSMMGLAAVMMGAFWRDMHWPLLVAASAALLVGALGGGLNAWLIARLKFPPLIVTLGTFSLFRGLAEGLTRGVENYSAFPPRFLFLGQGYLFGGIPVQLPVLVVAVLGFGWMLHRTAFGRTLYAIGFSAEGARYAGIGVRRRLAAIYIVSGSAASLAAVIYVAHLGQAKADAGTGYELMAITAVVLGGASIFGGRGTVWGTVLGLFAIVILQNGLQLSGQPTELAGILTGVLLILTILMDRWYRRSRAKVPVPSGVEEEVLVRNSQVAVLSAVILAAALLVAGSNWLLVRSVRQNAGAPPPAGKKIVIAMMPKAKGDPYFISCKKGADEAAGQLGVELLWDGPTGLDPAKQNEVVEAWITRGVDAIAVSVENKEAISTVLRKARAKGIKVITWDADAEPDARDYFINQATPQGIGYTLTDEAARILGGKGDFAIITASLTAANQNEWIKYIKERLAQKYPDLHLVTIRPSEGDRDRAFAETQTVLKVNPEVKLIMAIAAPAVPGAADAVKQSGRTDVKVTGLSLPKMSREFIKDGTVPSIVLWNTGNLGFLTVLIANALVKGDLKPGATQITAGKLNQIEIAGDEVRLGAPFIFTKDNVDGFDF
jgi:rhamnose transport system permease protein